MPLLDENLILRMRADEGLLRRELEAGGAVFRGKACKCIFHPDSHASAGVYHKDGAWKFKCQGCEVGGDIFDVRAVMNKSSVEEELQREAMRQAPAAPAPVTPTFDSLEDVIRRHSNVEAVYRYTDPDTGAVDMAVIRWKGDGAKRFTQACPAPGGRWWMKAPTVRPLYNRARIRGTETVVVVEGEKCVHALHGAGVVATTSPQGAKSADKADWTPLAGKRCILWADNDGAGLEYMDKVQKILVGLGCTIAKVAHEALDLGAGGDAADFVERYKGWKAEDVAAAVRDVLEDARSVGVIGEYAKESEEVIAGRRRSLPFVWRQLTKASRALMPGTVTCLFGPPGATKSLLVIESLVEWIVSGVRACVFMLEDDRNYHLRRAHAQVANNSRITDNDWVEQNGLGFRESLKHHTGILEEIGRSIWDAPDEEVSHEMLETWVEERAKAGFEIIMIDPVTAAQSKDKVWVADQRFIFKAKTLARRHNTRIVLVTHPRKGQKPVMVGLDDMAGGAAYQRFAHTVLLIERNEEEVLVQATVEHPRAACVPNRIIRVTKARNGPGAGARIGFNFNGDTLRFTELGLIDKP